MGSVSCIRKGYFHQKINSEGQQEEVYEHLEWEHAPVEQVFTKDGKPCILSVALGDRIVHVSLWCVRLGRVKIYLLDTSVKENEPADRELSARLYGGDRETRLKQEIILGIGGVRALRALGYQPMVWHLNEGHTAFVTLERILRTGGPRRTLRCGARESTPVHDLYNAYSRGRRA